MCERGYQHFGGEDINILGTGFLKSSPTLAINNDWSFSQ